VLGHDGVEALFYKSTPPSLLWPMIVLSTIATVIASQALISGCVVFVVEVVLFRFVHSGLYAGAFSLIAQAISMDMFPHISVVHTSKREGGQIYLPLVCFDSVPSSSCS
jgi:KUP system potassium uptake protein